MCEEKTVDAEMTVAELKSIFGGDEKLETFLHAIREVKIQGYGRVTVFLEDDRIQRFEITWSIK
jgi:hypothetical protein